MDLLRSSSPSNILLLIFLLILHFPIYGYATVRAAHIIAEKGFQSDCAFDLGDYSFNLCPLAGSTTVTTIQSSRDYLSKDDRMASETRIYEVALGGLKSNMVCGGDTWVCMMDGVFTRTQGSGDKNVILPKNKLRRNLKSPVTPIARTNGGHGKILASIIIKGAESIRFSPLQLSLDGGEAEGRPQSAEIEMVCNFNVDSHLEFINERDGIHSFRWTTRHGCPTNVEPMHMHPSRISITADDESEKNEGDDELLPPEMSTARRWVAIILVIVLTSAFCFSLYLASPRARRITGETMQTFSHSLIPILSTATIKLRPLGRSILALTPQSFLRGVGKPFRQESNQLVRWAEEDMILHETDVMVNGGGAYDEQSWNGVDFSEHIPLTAKGRSKDVQSYGSTPDVETFEERGLIGGIGRLFGK